MIKEESIERVDPDSELVASGGTWKCKLCQKIMASWDTAKNHILAHFAHPGGLTCLQCGLSFDNKVLFGIHMSNEQRNTEWKGGQDQRQSQKAHGKGAQRMEGLTCLLMMWLKTPCGNKQKFKNCVFLAA